MITKLADFIKNNRKTVFTFLLGVLILCTYICLYKFLEGEQISPGIRMLGYAGYFLLFTSSYLFFINTKRTILANIFLTIDLIIAVEIVCFFLLGMPGIIKKEFKIPNLPEDHIGRNIGDVPYADSIYTALLVNGKDTVYNVKYSIDHFNKRITPEHDSLKKKYALFFGCSIAFGHGLEDDQTLAYYFQKESRDFNSYNYGISGHGTNHMLARLQYQNLTKQVAEKNGAAFYIFFWDHIYRSIGTMNRYTDWLTNAPYYKMENDHLVRKKMFKDGRYFTSKIYELIYQTSIVKYFKLDFPMKLNKRHIDLVCEMISEAKKEYQKQFGNNTFYCVIYPIVTYSPEEIKIFKACLTEKEIDYIDLSENFKFEKKHTLGGDSHPNANTNALLAKELMSRYLKLELKNK